MNTKETILDSALTLFSEKGYDAVSVAEIAGAVGIKAPSLYKHFPSKQAIFDAILEKMQDDYTQRASSLGMDGSDAASDSTKFSDVSEDSLVGMVIDLFGYFLHDPYVSRFRRMLTIEQFSGRGSADLLSSMYFDGPVGYQGSLFGILISGGVLGGGEPDVLALEFYSPVFILLTVCDRQPDREDECISLLERHVRGFCSLHRVVP